MTRTLAEPETEARSSSYCVVVNAMPYGVVPAITGPPAIFASVPFLAMENSCTTLYTPPGQLEQACGTYTKLPDGSIPLSEVSLQA